MSTADNKDRVLVDMEPEKRGPAPCVDCVHHKVDDEQRHICLLHVDETQYDLVTGERVNVGYESLCAHERRAPAICRISCGYPAIFFKPKDPSKYIGDTPFPKSYDDYIAQQKKELYGDDEREVKPKRKWWPW